MNLLLLINFFAISSYLLGLIVTVQLVHYPSFIYVDRKLFNKFHLFHVREFRLPSCSPHGRRIVGIIGARLPRPTAHKFYPPRHRFSYLAHTATLSVPRHNKLSHDKNPRLISELVLTNWHSNNSMELKSSHSRSYHNKVNLMTSLFLIMGNQQFPLQHLKNINPLISFFMAEVNELCTILSTTNKNPFFPR